MDKALATDFPSSNVPSGFELEHLSPTIGTVVHGIDLRADLPAATWAWLRNLWLERKVIFFRDQPLTPEQHIALGRKFGRLETFPPTPKNSLEGYPEMLVFRRGADASERENFFHVDTPFVDPPVDGTIALLKVCPPVGGDTVFIDMEAAYAGLSPWLKRGVEGLSAKHSFDVAIRFYNPAITEELIKRFMDKFPPAVFPVVQVHPETGKRLLYVSIGYTQEIVGLPREESFALVKLLADQVRVPEYQCRFRWQTNSVAFWDNRAVQHYANFDYEGQYRELHRVVVLGEKRWPKPD